MDGVGYCGGIEGSCSGNWGESRTGGEMVQEQTRNFSLMMHHVAAEDAGMYECKIKLESGKENVSRRFQVNVRTGRSQINHVIVKVSISFPGYKVSTSLKVYILVV